MTHNDPQPIVDNKNTQKQILIPMLAIAILLLMVAWLAGIFDNKVAPNSNENRQQQQTVFNNTYTVIAKSNTIYEPVAASIEAKQATILSSRILARIEDIRVRSGDRVNKGDVLIKLEQNALNAQMLQAKQNISALKARHKEAEQNYQRAVELIKTNLISEFELDKNKADFQSITAELTAAKQALSQAKSTLSYATLIAPIDGRIVDRFAEPGDTAQPGSKLLSLYNPSSLRVEGQIREKLALTLTHGQYIDIELPTINSQIRGEIEEIVPAANTGARSFLVKVRIELNEGLLPGMYARMLIPAGENTTLMLPENKISHVGQLSFVWLNVNGEKQRRLIRLGKKSANNMVVVISGLNAGDEVITL